MAGKNKILAQQFAELVYDRIVKREREFEKIAGLPWDEEGLTQAELYTKIWEEIEEVEKEFEEKIKEREDNNGENRCETTYSFNDGSKIEIDIDICENFGLEYVCFGWTTTDKEENIVDINEFRWAMDYLRECEKCKKIINIENEKYIENEEGTYHERCWAEKLAYDLQGKYRIAGKDRNVFSCLTNATVGNDNYIYVVVEMHKNYQETDEDKTYKDEIIYKEIGRDNADLLPERGAYFLIRHRGRIAEEIIKEIEEELLSSS